jgi:acyl-coenzyme A synthetase/AMP-(fatty) acid ligase
MQEIMKVRGFQVAPAELEAHILLHADVADVCVVGVPDEYSGEVPLAYVVPSAKALRAMGKNALRQAKFKQAVIKACVLQPLS